MNDDQKDIGRLEGKVDMLIGMVREYQAAHAAEHRDIDGHLDAIYTDINQAKGAKSVIVATAAFLASGLTWLLHKVFG